jgi:hypothetical protein
VIRGIVEVGLWDVAGEGGSSVLVTSWRVLDFDVVLCGLDREET